jgi:hypothetical protein
MQIKYLIVVFLTILIFGGLYFKFLYDVPDGEEIINNWVSWLLVVSGTLGLMITGLWKTRNPFEEYQQDDYSNNSHDTQNLYHQNRSLVEEKDFEYQDRGEEEE